jgi:pimeloyl-ACP methyl ester carboxylesterase
MREADAVVAHSLGGLMALETLRRYEDLPVRRVVCLASPLCGSSAARQLRQHWWGATMLHHCADFLSRGLQAWEGEAQAGMIAGIRARGMGHYFTRFNGVSDGTVVLEETRLLGLTDFCQVDASHSGILFSRMAAHQSETFLRKGRFDQTMTDMAVSA